MRIAEMSAFHVRIPLRTTIRHALHSRNVNDTLIVRTRLDNGAEGWGEGLPRTYVTGESIQTAFEQLRTSNLVVQMAPPIETLEDAVEVCQSLRLEGSGGDKRDCFGNSVHCAIELSVLDAAARSTNQPLSALTELIPETNGIRKSQERVQYSAAITTMTPRNQSLLAWGVRLYGFRQCKVKVGADGVDDAACLKGIRRAAGAKMDLRIDANEAWTCCNLVQKLESLLTANISCVEQPVPHDDVAGLTEIRKHVRVPIMLDESLCSLSDARRAIDSETCDLLNVRLSKCGGFVNSLKLASMAHEAGLGYQLGCQVGESGILSAAGRHFATSVANIRYLEGSYDRFLVKERLTAQDLTFGRAGFARALDGAGLGIDLDQQALARTTIREEHWKF